MACRITDFMNADWVVPELKSTDKRSVLFELASVLSHATGRVDLRELHTKLIEREQKASTGADHGVAIPHATIESADRLMVVLGRAGRGIPFDALDNENSKLFFAVISPSVSRPQDPSYLQVISSICRLMRSASLRERLILASTSQDILEILRREEDHKLGQPLSLAP